MNLLRVFWVWFENFYKCLYQCLGPGSGAVGSPRFWLPGSGSAKICGSTDPDPRGKISTKNCKKKFTLTTQIWTIEKREIIKISWFLNGSPSIRIKISEKNKTKNFENVALIKNSVNFIEITWIWIPIRILIRIHFFPVRIQDPDPHPN